MPPRVNGTVVLAVPAAMVATSVPVESLLPPALSASNAVTTNVSLPALAGTTIEHDVPPAVEEQFGEVGVRFATTAGNGADVPSVSTIETDMVFEEM